MKMLPLILFAAPVLGTMYFKDKTATTTIPPALLDNFGPSQSAQLFDPGDVSGYSSQMYIPPMETWNIRRSPQMYIPFPRRSSQLYRPYAPQGGAARSSQLYRPYAPQGGAARSSQLYRPYAPQGGAARSSQLYRPYAPQGGARSSQGINALNDVGVLSQNDGSYISQYNPNGGPNVVGGPWGADGINALNDVGILSSSGPSFTGQDGTYNFAGGPSRNSQGLADVFTNANGYGARGSLVNLFGNYNSGPGYYQGMWYGGGPYWPGY